MERKDITRLGRERDDGLDIFSVEGVRLNTPRLSIPEGDESVAGTEGLAATPDSTTTSPGVAAASPAASQGAAPASPGAAPASPDVVAASPGAAASSPGAAASSPGDAAASPGDAAAAVDEAVAGPSGTAHSFDAATSTASMAVAGTSAKGKKEAEGGKLDSPDVTIQLRGTDVQWMSQMRRNPITGEGMETEEYTAAAKKKTFRDC